MFSYIRKKYHPLHILRQLSVYRRLQSIIDFDFRASSGSGIEMYVKFFRDLSLVLPRDDKEPQTRAAFARVIDLVGPDVFFDIGANVGLYAWHAKQRGIPLILLFEPDRENARLLAKTIKFNNLAGVFVFACAISSKVGIDKFIEDTSSGATGSLVDQRGIKGTFHSIYSMSSSIQVPTLNLDLFVDYCLEKIVIIKIDVEGAEELVFEGGQHFFAAVRPFVVVECFDASKLAMFEHLGYAIQPLEENSNYLLIPPSAPSAVA